VVLLSADCRILRQTLRPLAWLTHEEVALDAVLENGRLVARTSARLVAERLGIDPSTAANALKSLRERGLVTSSRETRQAGRFGLSVYQLGPVPGLSVVQPRVDEPYMVSPSMVQPDAAGIVVLSPRVVAPHVESCELEVPAPDQPDDPAVGADVGTCPVASTPDCAGATTGEGSPRRSGRSTVSPCSAPHWPGQTALDFGLGS
jgi:hypothetical protein